MAQLAPYKTSLIRVLVSALFDARDAYSPRISYQPGSASDGRLACPYPMQFCDV